MLFFGVEGARWQTKSQSCDSVWTSWFARVLETGLWICWSCTIHCWCWRFVAFPVPQSLFVQFLYLICYFLLFTLATIQTMLDHLLTELMWRIYLSFVFIGLLLLARKSVSMLVQFDNKCWHIVGYIHTHTHSLAHWRIFAFDYQSSSWNLEWSLKLCKPQGMPGTCERSILFVKRSLSNCDCWQQPIQFFAATAEWNSMCSIFCWTTKRWSGYSFIYVSNKELIMNWSMF